MHLFRMSAAEEGERLSARRRHLHGPLSAAEVHALPQTLQQLDDGLSQLLDRESQSEYSQSPLLTLLRLGWQVAHTPALLHGLQQEEATAGAAEAVSTSAASSSASVPSSSSSCFQQRSDEASDKELEDNRAVQSALLSLASADMVREGGRNVALQSFTAVHGKPRGHMRDVYRIAEHHVVKIEQEEAAARQAEEDEEEEEEDEDALTQEERDAWQHDYQCWKHGRANAIDLTADDEPMAAIAASEQASLSKH